MSRLRRLFYLIQIIAANPVNGLLFVADHLQHKRGRARRLRFQGIALTVRPGTTDLNVVQSCLAGEFDEVLNRTRASHRLIVDAGGYIGLVSILFATRFPDSQIVCLEPSSENCFVARTNCAPYPNIDVLKCGIGAHSQFVTLSDRGTGHWGFTTVDHAADKPDAAAVEMVRTITVSDLMQFYGRRGIDLIKLDIEGGEYELLRDRPEWIPKAEIIVAELHDRISPGATEAFEYATQGRVSLSIHGEKRMSLASMDVSA